ncbi:MAG: hypothetical protein QXP36_09325, partial [Conexivisphaerales archaeon]
MFHLINIDNLCKTLTEVQPRVFAGKKLLPDGLHSPTIFETDVDKKFKLTYFPLDTQYINPFLIYLFQKHHKTIYSGLLGLPVTFINDKAVVSNTGKSGIELLQQIYSDKYITIHPTIRALLERSSFDDLVAKNVIVIPPAFRVLYGENISDLDSLYIELGAKKSRPQPEIQKVMQRLFDLLLVSIKGKSGLLRSFLLSRRVDFSGRFVIVVDPTLDTDHVYLPYRSLGLLFAPSIINVILKHKYNIPTLTKLPETEKGIYQLLQHFYNRELPPVLEDSLCKIIDFVIADRIILAKRDPALHQGSWFAFRPLGKKSNIANSHTMSISPLITDPYNADFDGDTMAVFVPQTSEAIKEAESLLPSVKRFSPGNNTPFIRIKQDYILALYFLTKETNTNNPKKTYVYPLNKDWYDFYKENIDNIMDPITIKQRNKVFKSTVGRLIVNAIFNLTDYYNEPFNTKVANAWFNEVAKVASQFEFNDVIKKLNFLATDINQRFPTVLDLNVLVIPKNVVDISTLYDINDVEAFNKELGKIMSKVKDYMRVKYPSVFDMIESGARGSWDDIQQLIVARGFVQDIYGNVKLTPIKHSYVSGLDAQDVYQSASGWRKGMIDRTLNVAQSGYLTRQLTYALMPISITKHDCKTTEGLTIEVTEQN